MKDGWSCAAVGSDVVIQGPDNEQNLAISFHRTIRVPDTKSEYDLPPSLGKFPLVQASDYAHKLPVDMAKKGGLLMPMYQREAMWINFTAPSKFAIKIFVGGVNVVSGNPAGSAPMPTAETDDKDLRSRLQDYVVVPAQDWIDGVACSGGYVKQFVAMRMGDGYSIEAQLTGEETFGGIQFEVTPETVPILPEPGVPYNIQVKTLTGRTISLSNVFTTTTILEVMQMIQDQEGIPPDQQRLIFRARQLEQKRTLGACKIGADAIVRLVLRLRGGGHGPVPMALAAGGKIKQSISPDYSEAKDWDVENTMTFNVQILSTPAFEAITGRKAPPTPITAETYHRHGFPFFKLYEEQSQVFGNFGAVKSVAEIDGVKEMDLTFVQKVIGSTPDGEDKGPNQDSGTDGSYTVSENINGSGQKTQGSTGHDAVGKGRLASILNPAGPFAPGFRHISILVKEWLAGQKSKSQE
ncbi:Ubiquitin-60S ribosomal protein L40 [Cyphellophora attinorum]|uniref:Ubiquitin-60S ribosomal protein L40 n=1 Tax=Cyphellophora attinorum TaxID=1664694 RepID=A0A0N0NKU8_9EURO|nr:Ubiquitin-60S ribosomal protein L40 [Phialophora attinorum]KPI38448.1 Ubiquitin-60S ribosomal protein L40 [Phialophora attinorum]